MSTIFIVLRDLNLVVVVVVAVEQNIRNSRYHIQSDQHHHVAILSFSVVLYSSP